MRRLEYNFVKPCYCCKLFAHLYLHLIQKCSILAIELDSVFKNHSWWHMEPGVPDLEQGSMGGIDNVIYLLLPEDGDADCP